MTRRLVLTLVSLVISFTVTRPQGSVILLADSLAQRGDFRGARTLLAGALGGNPAGIDQSLREVLAFELDRLRRIRIDFTLTKEQLFAQLQQSLRNLTVPEYERWIGEGRFDSRIIDDTLRFFRSSRSNLFWRFPELSARRTPPPSDSLLERSLVQVTRSITGAAAHAAHPFVLPKRFRITMTVNVDANAAPAGDTIRAWLPVPRRYPYQCDLNILSTSSPIKHLAEEDSPIRAVYLEQVAKQNQSTVFKVEYEYTTYGVRFQLEPERVTQIDAHDSALEPFTGEGPHVVFTDQIRALSARLVGTATNPLVIARRLYNWVTDSIRYSYAPEYSTIRNIGDYCLVSRNGDCGEETLLLITLCRYNRIPARWQSGWLTLPCELTIHDWAEIYIAPYGWVPADPYMGIRATQYLEGLPKETRKFVRDFYFGGLDQYRMAANSDHCQQLVPAKRSMRSDNVDFQRGELEHGSTNIYFDRFSYDLTPQETDLSQ